MDEQSEPTVSQLIPFVEPDGIVHVRLALRNMEIATLRQQLAEANRPLQSVDRFADAEPTDDEMDALLGDARMEGASDV